MALVLPGKRRTTHNVCGLTCPDWWATRRADERELMTMLHEAQRRVAVREGRPDPGPFVEPRRPCTEASRKRAARESAAQLAELEQAVTQRHQELRAGLAWSPLLGTPAEPPQPAPEPVRPKRRETAPERSAGGTRPDPREPVPVAPEATEDPTPTPPKKRPRRPAGFIDSIDTVPGSRRR
ncbi:hypothetical protein [Micromonospora sp. LH3U1]|uniref:hypothetical protein n=1 Tax=Micromonospora sp. LH3U1 TaxID=3018339 RepID=UPI002349391A|nr:hypothetical protein [Micromonospora sp. LH3U1]WCN80025.1 hypothetical protein PCA76_24160 [Micromonospora sp. LH3U1]